ncbi:glycine cleavage system T protein [Chloroherpeton thalassium ATCC 35110]|uniref:Aminomethyltransferase n=1 Tax=Chloroherpeton thalassium (strain ATCC 35110 / GB-78) TaxID=517418 RepID=GCST_CHLT3|nr:glycine cleavage system aminomethyltransferase GcvT [Chloroherpeton thalassium]B3QV24.1 RecName: Full=Aminomethyltransferase; AltName: Full=Glycine cleavage system T protein [Chloroherpeton thalassium ATCC 35110]ACF12978.1 glycine cleavage system T protein [Chloroherpeton thalassium ATCC 35110]
MKYTPLHKIHQQLGAKLVDFAGFEMPVQYDGILVEHKAVREAVGLFDVSHMGEFEVKGKGAKAFLQNMTTNDVESLCDGKAQYSLLLYEDGGVVDDLLVYKIADEHYFLIVNASNIEKDFDWLKQHQPDDEVVLENRSDELSLIAIQGPKAEAVLSKLTDVPLDAIKYYHFVFGDVCGKRTLISRTGYTGEAGFELCMANEHAEEIWHALIEAGLPFGIVPVGLGARDTLRLEMGYSLYGHEIDHQTNPYEAQLGWITKLQKGDFIGKNACVEKKLHLEQTLVGFTLTGKNIPRQGYKIQDLSGTDIGVVCSGTLSPTLGKPIGTGYVKSSFSKIDSKVYINIRGKLQEAAVVKVPFLHKNR